MDTARYSVVIPIHNEQESLPELVNRLTAVMNRLDGPCEVILVDDGSTDNSYDLMIKCQESDERFRFLQLSRNFGQQIAITAGLDHAVGEAVVIMDGDLQDPPETIPELIARWQEGFEVVFAVRGNREGESSFKRRSSNLFYRVLNRLTEVESPVDAGDFRLLDRSALDALRSMPERNRYVRGMISWVGFRQTGVTYERPARFAGTTKYPLKKMTRFAIDGIVSFSNFPLRLALTLGFAFSLLSFLGAVWAIIARLSGSFVVPGWASLVVVTFFLGGVQLMVIGVMGEYIARIYDEVKARPLYIVRKAKGLDTEGLRGRSRADSGLSKVPYSRG